MTTAQLQGNLSGDVVRGRFFAPGTWQPSVNGKPSIVHVARDVAARIYEKLRAKVAAGKLGMRLSHPGTGLPLTYGRVSSLRLDADQGEIWIADSIVDPAMQQILTAEAQAQLFDMGLSIFGPCVITPRPDGSYQLDDADPDYVDIVTTGAAPGSRITRQIPAGLAAQLQLLTAPSEPGDKGSEGANTPAGHMAGPSDIPEAARARLSDAAQRVYVDAYNQAITSGLPPETAAQNAWDEANRQPGDTTMTEKIEAELRAQLDAQKRDVDKLTADLSAERKNNETLKTAFETQGQQIAKLEAARAELAAERAEANVKEDIRVLMAAGKVTPATKDGMLEARRMMGKEKFAVLAATMPVIVRPGELGHVEVTPPADAQVERCAELVQKFKGPSKVIAAGLHKITPGMRAYLAANHADDEDVQQACRPELAAIAAARTKAGGA